MSIYMFSVIASFVLIIISETYRCRRMPFKMFVLNGAVSFIPGINILIAAACVHFAINK